MERRDIIKAVGGIGAVAGVGGLGLLATTERARATANQDFGSASVSSDDGTVEYVAIFGDSIVRWDGFDTPATQFKLTTEARVVEEQSTFQYLYDTGMVQLDNDQWGNYDEDLSGPGTSGYIETGIGLDSEDGSHDPTIDWHIMGTDPDRYGLPPAENRLATSLVENPDDGTTKNFTIEVRTTYQWYDSGGNEVFSKSWTSTVDLSVTNEAATATGESDDGSDGATAA